MIRAIFSRIQELFIQGDKVGYSFDRSFDNRYQFFNLLHVYSLSGLELFDEENQALL